MHGTPGTASALHKLGQTARRRGDAETALRLLTESVEMQREIGNKQGLVECLVALAGLTFEWGTSERAVELLGASQAALEELDAPLAPADAVDFERDQARGRSSLAASAWIAADQRGRSVGLADALALAVPAAAREGTAESGRAVAGGLSPREQEVVALIARGLSNREIAAALTISERTAANHVEHIMAKLDLRSRAQVAVWAVRQDAD